MPDISTILQFIFQAAIGLVGLSFLVFIHEGGHFLMAKKAGVRVKTFSIGFGKTIFGFTRGDTEYCIKAIPFGGYVAMAGEQPGEGQASQDDFSEKSIPARMGIALGGPVVNIVFAFVALVALYMVGVEEPVINEYNIREVLKDSPAEKSGLLSGDIIIAIDGKDIQGIQDFHQKIALKVDETVALTCVRGGDTMVVSVSPELHELGIAHIGVVPDALSVTAAKVVPESPAATAGFHNKDEIVGVNGVVVSDAQSFIEIVRHSEGKELAIEVKRKGGSTVLNVTPKKNSESGHYQIGVQISEVYSKTEIVHRSFSESISASFHKNIEYSTMVFVTLQKLLRGKIPLKALSGPVGIVQVIGNTFRHSIRKFVEFLAMISLNLGIFNLLPLIITDGGIIFFLFIEALRRKPLDVQTQLRINQVAISFFIALALFITFHDILKIPMFLD